MNINKNTLKSYNSSRTLFKRKYICYAPFVNMYFNIHGDAAPCWLGFNKSDSYPNKSISEIWFGERFETFRKKIKTLAMEETCGLCLDHIKNGNYVSVLAKAYDHIGKPKRYPLLMELELDNTCNLECVMCNGKLSSSIRKNREKKEPPNIPYDDAFVEQLNEFIPHLKELRLNGGEPFLSSMCMKIIENALHLNPSLNIVMATNGTIWNKNIAQLLEKGRFHINISIDSLVKTKYESIRLNADFDITMQNFYRFLDYCRRKKTKLCVLVNPMRINWDEMPNFLAFCNKHNTPLWFNTVINPISLSLWALPYNDLLFIYQRLKENKKVSLPKKGIAAHNYKVYNNLINVQIYNWMITAKTKSENDFLVPEDLIKRIHEYMIKINLPQNEMDRQLEIIDRNMNHIIEIYDAKIPTAALLNYVISLPVEEVYTELLKPLGQIKTKIEELFF